MATNSSRARIPAARTDDRAESIRYRQDQLQHLHNKTLSLEREIREALVKDSGFTVTECNVEFILTLEAIRADYNSLDLQQSLEDEYKIANDQSSPEHTVAFGTVLIKPARSFPFYSILSAISAAIAAGNSVILELGVTLRQLNPIIKLALSVLDRENLVQVDQEVKDQDLLQQCLIIDQQGSDLVESSTWNSLRVPKERRVIAVVDRTADIESAARWLVLARFSFRGQSPYAPIVVLVNEWVKSQLVAAINRCIVAFQNDADRPLSPKGLESFAKKDIQIIAMAKAGVLADVGETGLTHLQLIRDFAVPTLAVASVTSLEDAILHANTGNSHTNRSLNHAAYIFASPKQAKYLCQFINSQVTYVNYIPVNHLVGPLAPLTPMHLSSVPVAGRTLPLSALRITRPLYTATGWEESSKNLTLCLQDASMPRKDMIIKKQNQTMEEMLREALKPLKKTGQPLQMRGIGFFEQGILTGLAMFGLPILAGLGTASYYAFHYLWQHFS